jgi:type I restriction enzyme M protein
MDQTTHNKIVSFIWGIADDVLRDLSKRGSQQQLLADFEDHLNGFAPNVQNILENFKFRNQIPTLSKADVLGTLITKFLDPEIDLSPAGIDNHAMGTVFEELVRKFKEENDEEAGEHWPPRDAVRLMANLVFLPIEKDIKSGTYAGEWPIATENYRSIRLAA